jgi:uncharacterized membrane protein
VSQKKSSNPNNLPQSREQDLPNITPEVATVIKGLPLEKRKVIMRALTVSQHHSGPLPDGESIRIYDEVIPNGGDRLMSTVEKQLDHRIQIESNGVNRTFNQSSTGQWMGFGIAIIFGLISWDLAKSGQAVVASILGTVDLVALVTVFITGKLSKK